MRRIIFVTLMMLTLYSCKQNEKKQVAPAKQEVKENVIYKLYPTDNIWTFLKLDTRNGKIWQVQYSLDDNFRGEIVLNDKSLVTTGNADNGRFMLYPTKNMYNFILLDQIYGKMWQVQWSIEEDGRCIFPMQ